MKQDDETRPPVDASELAVGDTIVTEESGPHALRRSVNGYMPIQLSTATRVQPLVWRQEPRLYDFDGRGTHWHPWPAPFDFNRGVDDVSNAVCLMGAVFGKRSDGMSIFVSMQVPLDATDKLKAWYTKRSLQKIESFLDDRCSCERHRICEWHSKLHGAVIHEGDMIPQC